MPICRMCHWRLYIGSLGKPAHGPSGAHLAVAPPLERGEDGVAARRVDVRAIELLVARLIAHEDEVDAELALDLRDRRRRDVVAEVDEDVVRVGADGGGAVGLDHRAARALVFLWPQVPPEENHGDEQQDPDQRRPLGLGSVVHEKIVARRGGSALPFVRR